MELEINCYALDDITLTSLERRLLCAEHSYALSVNIYTTFTFGRKAKVKVSSL